MKIFKEIKYFLLFFGMFLPFLIVGAIFISGKPLSEISPKLFPRISDEEVKQTIDNCERLALLPSFKKVRDHQVVKSGTAVFSSEYLSNDNPKTVKEYFVNLLVSQGWERASVDSTDGMIFYKGKYSINFEHSTLNGGSDKKYIISCAWSATRHGIIGDLFQK